VIGGDEARLLGVVAEGAADLRDGFLEDAVGREVVGPDFLEQLLLGEHAIVMLGEVAQHAHGAWFERHHLAAAIEEVDAGREVKDTELQSSSVGMIHWT
jgi:hypothetical protein